MLKTSGLFSCLSLVLICGTFIFSGCTKTARKVKALPEASSASDSLAKEIALDHYTSGAVFEESNELHKAAVEYNISRLFDPTSSEVSIALARVYQKLEEHRAALIILEQARRHNPHNTELFRALIEAHLRNRSLNPALEYYGILERKGELNFEETTRYTMLLERLNKVDMALDVCKRWFERKGPSPEIYERIGLLLIARRDFISADTAFKRLIALDPQNHRYRFLLGGFAVARQDWADAEVYFRAALAIEPSEPLYWQNLIMVLGETQQSARALEAVDLAIVQIPDDPQFYDIKARILERSKRYEEALKCLDKSIALDSLRVSPYLTMGYIYHSLKLWDASAEAYEMAIRLEPDNAVALNNYAYMLSVSNQRPDEALKLVDSALELEPDNASFRDTRGWIFYRLGRYEEALSEVQKAMQIESNNAELYEHLGYIYQALNQHLEAARAWKKAAELEPDNEEYRRLAQ